MTAIASPQNPRLQQLRRLRRRRERERERAFVAEGEDLIEAAERAGRRPLAGYRVTGSGIGGDDFLDVEPRALASACSLASGARVLAVYRERYERAAVGPLCLYLHGVSDPGNVGAVLRCADAFGASSVALGDGCADPHSPKAVRASMGAIFSVRMARVALLAPDLSALPGRRIALVARRGVALHELARGGEPLTLLIGAERDGLPQELRDACEQVAHIPIASESLNAAAAAAVALYELTRGRLI
ncbi:MAG: TrmH family RNA methyltransferase [Solirubrobacteraceae bacterium]